MPVDPNVKETRDPEYLEPELRRRWELAFAEYKRTYPSEPEPFLVQTYRSPQRQNELYEQGRTTPGPIVTGVKGGGSYHNYIPALAFDVAFHNPVPERGPWGRVDLFEKFAEIAKRYDIEWGGDWPDFVDRPHFQVPRYKLSEKAEGKSIPWKPVTVNEVEEPTPTSALAFKRVFIVHGETDIEELELEKVSLVGEKLYIKPVPKEETPPPWVKLVQQLLKALEKSIEKSPE